MMENKWILASVGGVLLLGALFFALKDTGYPLERSPKVDTETLVVSEPIRMVFTGDVMLSRTVGAKMARRNDYGYPARKVKDFFAGADIVAINLEGPMSDKGTEVGSKYSFRHDLKSIETLELLNVSVASLANNHMWDWGKDALIDTGLFLEKNGILAVGAGKDYASANALKIKEVRGTKIGFLSYTDLYPASLSAGPSSAGVSSFDLERTTAEIKKIKDERQVDILIILFHWGEEYEKHPTEKQKRNARALIDAGADMIIGHHPHVTQDIERYKNGWIFYSLGNFIFDQYFSTETMKGFVVEAYAEEGKIKEVKLWESFLNKEYEVERISERELTF